MPRKLLLVDFSALIHKAVHVNNTLSYKGKPTGALYGFIQQLTSIANQVRPYRTVVCLDTKPYFRSIVYPEYKQLRSGPSDEWKAASIALGKKRGVEFLRLSGIPYLGLVGLEADDLMTTLALNEEDNFDKVVIASGDSDLYQCLTDKICLLKGSSRNGDRTEVTKDIFEDAYPGIPLEQWALVQAITGGHNGLQGVQGVGEVTALSFVRDKEVCLKTARGRKIQEDWARVQFNLPLCTLPPNDMVRGLNSITIPTSDGVGDVRSISSMLSGFGIEFTAYMEAAVNLMSRR